MKRSLSSTITSFIVLMSLLLLFPFTSKIKLSQATLVETQISPTHHHYHYTNSVSFQYPPPLCLQLQRKHHYTPRSPPHPSSPPPPLQNSDNEIDPRYGVEKRLVPTGPNPLHN
ncbi:hypothetical protein ACHQM5_006506 [Ranunculus cassubicifolius]